jgi:16S rRNA (guanine(527)-N(7))-methyltransferase RsmG
MRTAHIADLLAPFLEQPLAPSQLDRISTYIDLLQRWNARINLTSIRQEEEIVTRHFGESFFLARHLFPTCVARTLLSANAGSAQPPDDPKLPNPCHPSYVCHPERSEGPAFPRASGPSASTSDSAPINVAEGSPSNLSVGGDVRGSTGNWQPATDNSVPSTGNWELRTENWVLGTDNCPPRVLDLGSGAGFPALPLKLWIPHIHLTLIESNHKKAAFLREVARALTLTNIDIIVDRAESLSSNPAFPKAAFVTLRAVEHFDEILPLAASFLAPNGTLALLIGSAQLPHLSTHTNIRWNHPIHIPQSHSRMLVLGSKR